MIDQGGLKTTNCVFREGKTQIYYCPTYLRLKVKNFTEMNLDSLDAKMNATIIFTVFYGDLPSQIVEQVLQGIVLLFNRDNALELKSALEVKLKHKEKEKSFTYTIRQIFSMRIESNIFWSPFEIINLILTITIQSVSPKDQKKKWLVKFNLMDHPSQFVKVSYSEEGTFGNYDLAQALLLAEYSNNRVPRKLQRKIQKNKPAKSKMIESQQIQQNQNQSLSPLKKNQNAGSSILGALNNVVQKEIENSMFRLAFKKPKHYQYAHFTVPLYKFPTVSLATIFLPLWLLGIINLGIYFQNESLADRIASIAALMIAFVALIPTIREQIPPNPTITFVQILVYLETLTSFLCLIHSLDVRNVTGFQLNWTDSGLFLASAIITLLNIVSVVVLFLLHKFIWEPGYNRFVEQETQEEFNPLNWSNQECDHDFSLFKQMQMFSEIPKQTQKKKKMQSKPTS